MKTLNFLAIVVLSMVVAFGVGVGIVALTGNGQAFFAVFFGVTVLMAMAMGAFDMGEKESAKHDSIRHKTGYYCEAA